MHSMEAGFLKAKFYRVPYVCTVQYINEGVWSLYPSVYLLLVTK